MSLLTIITPTYNRAELLKNCWISLKNQTCHQFQWLIIDDGSTDQTREAVDGFMVQSPGMWIDYHYKENGGKHTALNYAHPYIEGEYILILDSDDCLVAEAVEKVLNAWNQYGGNPEIGEINFLRGITPEEPLCYVKHPGVIVDPLKEQRIFVHGRDCCETYRKEIFIQHPFKVFPGEKFLGEGSAFFYIEESCKCIYFNEILYTGEYLSDGLTMLGRKMRLNNPKGGRYNSFVYMNRKLPLKKRYYKSILYVVYSKITGDRIFKDNPYRLLTAAAVIPGNVLYLFWKHRYSL